MAEEKKLTVLQLLPALQSGGVERGTLHPNLHPLAEADRCAEWILEWLKKKN